MDNLKKISLIIGISTIVLSLGGAFYYTYLIYEITDFRVIEKFPDSDPRFHTDYNEYRVEERKLVSTVRGDVIFPDDELYYKLKVYNLKDHPSKITYELEKFKGGKREEPIKSDYWILKPKTDETRTIKIFLKEEGSYDLKLNLLFYNDTDGTKYAQFAPPSDKVNVLSHTDKLQADANEQNYYGVFLAAGIGLLTAGALFTSVYFSHREVKNAEKQNILLSNQIKLLQKQNRDLKEQTSIQNRPWISIADVERKHDLSPRHLKVFVKNYGDTPARDTTVVGFTKLDEITLDELDNYPPSPYKFSLAPKETMSFRLPVSNEEYKEGHGGSNGLFFALKMEYTYEKNKHGKSIVTGTINELTGRGMEYTEKKFE